MKRPLIYALVFLTAGILTGYYNSALLFTGGVLGSAYAFYRWRPAFVFILFYVAGILVIYRVGMEFGASAPVTGIITDEVMTSGGYRFTVADDRGFKVSVQTANEGPVGVGGRVEFDAELEALSRRRNPGGFDEYMYLRARGVRFKAYSRYLTPAEPGNSLRGRISQVYDDILPARESGIIKAMILGDRAGLDEEIKNLYRVAGIYHILAISGLHISVLAVFIGALLSKFLGRRASGIATIAFLGVYCVFVGFSASVVRASIMYTVIIFGDIMYREKDPPTSLAFAAILLLLYQPLYLWDAGFLYSFSAAAGIITLNNPIKSAINKNLKVPPVIGEMFSATLSATIFTTPIAAYYFHHIMPYGLIVNMLVTPLASLVVVLGFLAGIAGLLIKPLALMLAGSLYVIFKIYEGICGFFVGLPGAEILTGSWPLILIGGWYLLIALRGRPRVFGVSAALYAALVFAAVALPKPTEVYSLDLNTGECTVLIHKGEAFVFDGGGGKTYELNNYLSYKGIRTVGGYFGLHDELNQAEAIVTSLEDVRAIFASPALRGLAYYANEIYFEEISPGLVLERNGLRFRITDTLGVIVRDGDKELEIK